MPPQPGVTATATPAHYASATYAPHTRKGGEFGDPRQIADPRGKPPHALGIERGPTNPRVKPPSQGLCRYGVGSQQERAEFARTHV